MSLEDTRLDRLEESNQSAGLALLLVGEANCAHKVAATQQGMAKLKEGERERDGSLANGEREIAKAQDHEQSEPTVHRHTGKIEPLWRASEQATRERERLAASANTIAISAPAASTAFGAEIETAASIALRSRRRRRCC